MFTDSETDSSAHFAYIVYAYDGPANYSAHWEEVVRQFPVSDITSRNGKTKNITFSRDSVNLEVGTLAGYKINRRKEEAIMGIRPWSIGVRISTTPTLAWKLGIDYINEKQRSLEEITSYDLLGRTNKQRINPPINEGRLTAGSVYIEYGDFEDSNFGFTEQDGLRLSADIASDRLGGDFNYTRFDVDATWSFPTFLQRRLQPNRLTWYVDAGTAVGDVPVQSHGVVDASMGVLNPIGTLRSISFRPYEGERYVSIVAEHNFQTAPFELVGLQTLAERDWGLIMFGGAAQTWIDSSLPTGTDTFRTTDGWHTEVGISINRFLGWFRLDVVRRLDQPSWQLGVGVGQIF